MTTELQFKTKPFPHQRETVERFRDHDYFCLFHEQGLGKTKTLLDIWQNAKHPPHLLVMAPNSLHHNWGLREIPTHVHRDVDVFRYTDLNAKTRQRHLERFIKEKNKQKVFLLNVEAVRSTRIIQMLERFLRLHPNTMFVIDESTCIKTPSSHQTKVITHLARYANRKALLSGTPMTQGPQDMYSQLEFLGRTAQMFPTFTGFKKHFCVEVPITRPSSVIGPDGHPINSKRGGYIPTKIVDYKNLEDLSNHMARFSSRLLKKDVLDLPEKIFTREYVEMTAPQRKAYTELKRQAITELTDGSFVTAETVLQKMIRFQQIASGFAKDEDGNIHELPTNKWQPLEPLLESSEKVVFFSTFTENIKQQYRYLTQRFHGSLVRVFTGHENSFQRNEAVDAFQKGETRFLLCTSAAEMGITLHAANHMVYWNNGLKLLTREQSQDRIHRIGQERTCFYTDILTEGTMEEKVLNILQGKKDLTEMILEDLKRIILESD